MRDHECRKAISAKKTKSIREVLPEGLVWVPEVITWVRLNGAKQYVKWRHEADSTLEKLTLKSPKRIRLCRSVGLTDRSAEERTVKESRGDKDGGP